MMEPSSVIPLRLRLRRGLRSVLCIVAFFATLEIVRVTAGPNWHTVVPGEIYRAAHLSSAEIKAVAQRFGIKTIINLRDCCPWEPWYQDETSAVEALGLTRLDFLFSAYVPPSPKQLQKLWQALETAPRPIFIHCRRGADRTGLASTIAALYQADDTLTVDQAESEQLSLLKGHAGVGRVMAMGDVIDLYKNWLIDKKLTHNRSHLKEWIMNDYRPSKCWATVDPLTLPQQLPVGEPQLLRVRVHNQSNYNWSFKTGSNVGMHLRGYIEPVEAAPPPWQNPSAEKPLRKLLSAGFMNVTVPPKQSIELDVAVPALREPGKYTLFLDIIDEQNQWFGNMLGSVPLKQTVEIIRAPVAQR